MAGGLIYLNKSWWECWSINISCMKKTCHILMLFKCWVLCMKSWLSASLSAGKNKKALLISQSTSSNSCMPASQALWQEGSLNSSDCLYGRLALRGKASAIRSTEKLVFTSTQYSTSGNTYLGESTGGLTKDRRASFTMSCMRWVPKTFLLSTRKVVLKQVWDILVSLPLPDTAVTTDTQTTCNTAGYKGTKFQKQVDTL